MMTAFSFIYQLSL